MTLTKFNIGDRVRITGDMYRYTLLDDTVGIVEDQYTINGIAFCRIKVTNKTSYSVDANDLTLEHANSRLSEAVVPVDGEETFELPDFITRPITRKASITAPQTRLILKHLEARGSISPMEAIVSYGATRLAARIRELREAGYKIVTDMRRDQADHPYARYTLIAKAA